MNRREFTTHLLSGLGVAALSPVIQTAAAATAPTKGARRPNLVFVFSDQHSYKYTGYAGHPHVRTPNLDRIAARGATFTNTYCGNPVCTPARACMITGMYASDSNSFCNATVWDGSHPSWGVALREQGYRLYATGKLDLNPAFPTGFTEEIVSNQHVDDPDTTAFFRRPLCLRENERPMINGRSRPKRAGSQGTTTRVVNFIRKQTGDQPWVAYAGIGLPHPPYVGLEEHYNYYYPNRVDLPAIGTRIEELEALHPVFRQMRNFKNNATPIPEERQRRARAAYYAMVTEVDDYIGEIWRTLEESGQLENTIFVYSSDHGEMLGDHGLWMKNSLFESSAHVPLVIAGAGIPSGKIVDTPTSHVDLIRTFLEWGGAAASPKLRGHSLVPLMHGERGDHPGWAYSESHSEGNSTGSFMIRKGDWKYLHFSWYDEVLFNLRDDPNELVNRIDDPAAQRVREELSAILRSQVDPLEVTNRAFTAQRARMDRLLAGGWGDKLDHFSERIGKGQAIALLTGIYGPSEIKPAGQKT